MEAAEIGASAIRRDHKLLAIPARDVLRGPTAMEWRSRERDAHPIRDPTKLIAPMVARFPVPSPIGAGVGFGAQADAEPTADEPLNGAAAGEETA